MERESLRTDPGVLDIVLAVVEDLAVELLIGIIAAVLADTVELALLQQCRQAVGFFFLFFQLVFYFLLELLELGRALLLLLWGESRLVDS